MNHISEKPVKLLRIIRLAFHMVIKLQNDRWRIHICLTSGNRTHTLVFLSTVWLQMDVYNTFTLCILLYYSILLAVYGFMQKNYFISNRQSFINKMMLLSVLTSVAELKAKSVKWMAKSTFQLTNEPLLTSCRDPEFKCPTPNYPAHRRALNLVTY